MSMLGRPAELVSEAEVATEEERARVGIWDGFDEEEATPGVVGRLLPRLSTDDVLRIAVPIRARIDFGGVLVDISNDHFSKRYQAFKEMEQREYAGGCKQWLIN